MLLVVGVVVPDACIEIFRGWGGWWWFPHQLVVVEGESWWWWVSGGNTHSREVLREQVGEWWKLFLNEPS